MSDVDMIDAEKPLVPEAGGEEQGPQMPQPQDLPTPATVERDATRGAAGRARVEVLDVLDMDDPTGFNSTFGVEVPWGGRRAVLKFTTENWEQHGDHYEDTHAKPMMPYDWDVLNDPGMLQKLSLPGPGLVRRYDPADAKYKKALERWSEDYNLWVLAACLLTPMRAGGKLVEATKDKAKLLREKGMTVMMSQTISQQMVQASNVRRASLAGFSEGGSGP